MAPFELNLDMVPKWDMRPKGRRKGCEMDQVLRQYMSVDPYVKTEVRVTGRTVSHNRKMKGLMVRCSKVH